MNCIIMHNTKNSETVKTVLCLCKLLLTPNFAIGIPYWESWGLIKHSPNDPTVSTVSFCRIIPFFSGLNNKIRLKFLSFGE
ncbi:MAG: hypothetical protein ACTSVE_07100 [Candidatus Helarchaeota archaeon]